MSLLTVLLWVQSVPIHFSNVTANRTIAATFYRSNNIYHLCLSRGRRDDFSIGKRERNLRVKQDLYDYTK